MAKKGRNIAWTCLALFVTCMMFIACFGRTQMSRFLDREATLDASMNIGASHAPEVLARRSVAFADPVQSSVYKIGHLALTSDHENALEILLNEQERTPMPPLIVESPSLPPLPIPKLALECGDPMFRFQHMNSTCRDWIPYCIQPDYTIRNARSCNGFSDDPSHRGYIDPKCSSSHYRKKHHQRCQPAIHKHNFKMCRNLEFFTNHEERCRNTMQHDPDLVHNPQYALWANPRCRSHSFLWEHKAHRHDNVCLGWEMEQRFQECRVVHDQPGYYTDDDCLTACMRDPKCPLKYTPQVKERVRTLCRQETSNARKVHFAVGFADVCRAVLEVGEVFVDGRFEMMSGDAPTRLELQTPWWVYSRGGV